MHFIKLILIMTYNTTCFKALALLIFVCTSVYSYAQETTFTDVEFTGVFGGTVYDGSFYNAPSGSQPWAGFANEDVSLYPLSFVNGGAITFTGATTGTDAEVYFRFEYNPYPDTEPSFNTLPVTVSGEGGASYSIDIPSQGTNTYSSFLLYVTTTDAPVSLTDVSVTASFSSSEVYGCTDPTATNFDSSATIDDGSCVVPLATVEFVVDMNGVDQPSAEYALVTVNGSWNGWNGFGVELFDEDGNGVYTGSLEIEPGTTFEYVVAVSGEADAYSGWGLQWGDGCLNSNVTVTAGDAGTVTTSTLTPGCADVLGCLDDNADNYTPDATAQAYDQYGNLSCVYASCDDIPEYGCIYSDGFGAFNAEFNAALCVSYGGTPCEDPNAEISGCTDESSANYNPDATIDDGSCTDAVVLTITTTVCNAATSVAMTGPWWGWDPAAGPVASDNGDGSWTFTFDPAPTDNMEYLLVVDGVQEDLVAASTASDDWSCTPLTDYWSYANRQWIVGSGDVSNTYGTCGACEVESTALTITTAVCDAATSVAMTGPWWGWDPAAGPAASDNGDGSWTFTFDPAPTDNMEYLLVVDGVQEDLVASGTASDDWSCTPLTDYWSYANRQWVVGSGDVSNTYGTCGSCEVESTTATIEFVVDMNGVDQPSADYDNVVVNGSWNGWAGWGVTLSDEDADGVYTGSLEIEQGTTFEYVVAVTGPADGYSGWGMQWGDGCGGANVFVTAGVAGSVTTTSLTAGCSEVLGCIDVNATNYDASASSQAYDQYGNLSCIYASCEDIPDVEGCIYADSYASFNPGFGPLECANYGGTACTVAILGCLDANATNYDGAATEQAYDQYGNSSCIYASCADVPEYGCIYADGFGAFNATFGAADCVTYGGTPCEEPVAAEVLTITTTVCDAASSVQMTGPWWGWDPNAGPAASDNGDGTWTFTFDPAPTDNMEYLLVVDGIQEDLVASSTASEDWSCAPITDYWSYANRQWVVGSGDVSNVYGQCGDCVEIVLGCMYSNADNYNALANDDDGSCLFAADCLGDLDGDGLAGTSDLLLLLSGFGNVCE